MHKSLGPDPIQTIALWLTMSATARKITVYNTIVLATTPLIKCAWQVAAVLAAFK